ncbi:hypothetical protein ACRRVA_03450, partial [Candidatus Cardinium hertigii]|uniref:hypothetical protein n=1 Tax=Candidatus Cardinium hertigii TaxID=247481 RepID=UPI003D7D8677
MTVSACSNVNRYAMNSSSSSQDLDKKKIESNILSNPKLDGNKRLHLAVSKGNIEEVRWLLSCEGINVNAKSDLDYTPL